MCRCSDQDRLTIYVFLEDNRQTQLMEVCGQQRVLPLMSAGRRMKVVFRSEDREDPSGHSGFTIDYQFITGMLLSLTGTCDALQTLTSNLS